MGDEERSPLPVSAIRPLVVGTQPFPGESLSSVLVRACEANVFTKTSHLLNLIGLPARASEALAFTHPTAAPALAKLLGTTTEEIESRMHPAAGEDLGYSTVHWFGSSIQRRHVEAPVRRFAPHSLAEHAHFPAIWAVRLLDFCPITTELLYSECPQCSRPLGWRACRSLLKCERCGASLLSAEALILPPDLREAAQLGAALVSPMGTVRQAALSSLPNPFSTWAPAEALFGLVTLGEAQLSLAPSHNSSAPAASAARIAAGVEFARDWPDSLARFVKTSTAKSNSTSVRLGLGPLGKLFAPSAKRTPIRDLIRATISTSLGEAMVPAKLFSGAMVDGACRDGMLSTLEASKQLGITMKRLRKLEGRSNTFLARHNVHGGAALYDKAAISRLRDVLGHSVKPDVCARRLGIPGYCMGAFISAGLVEVVTYRDAKILTNGDLITEASIVALRERLQQQSRKIEGGVTLRRAMRRNGDPEDWVAVFVNMISGRIRLQLNPTDDPLSDAVVVGTSDVARHISRRSIGPGIQEITVSAQTAAKIIGATPMFVSTAVKMGLLKGEMRGRDYALPLEQVLTFQKEIVVAEELREVFGGHQRSICSQLHRAGIKSVATINRANVWRRSDIESYIARRDRP